MKLFYFLITALLLCACNTKDDQLLIKRIDNYPSASAIEYIRGRLFITGDDAPFILVLDSNFRIADSISLIDFSGKRIPKEIKPDIEASALLNPNDHPELFLFGSGSLAPYRNFGWKIDLKSGNKKILALETFFSQIKSAGIKELNIEGACSINQSFLFANRGHKDYPQNSIIITDTNFLNTGHPKPLKILPVISTKDSLPFRGVSGLCYAKENDILVMTVSTEDTRSSYEDGSIGKSYLWLVNNASRKINDPSLTPGRMIDLEKIDARFKGQKIESATVIGETKERIQMILVADNDEGSSTLFKLTLKII